MSNIERSQIARARGLAQAIAKCRDDARLDGIREGAAEIAELLDLPITDDRGAVEALRVARQCIVDYNPQDDAGFYDDPVQAALDRIDSALVGQ